MVSKVIYLLNVENYAPEITRITYPFIRYYAQKIGATVQIIDQRKFPGWPPVYEKLQIYELAQANKADWHLYIDSDTLIHPECVDFTDFLPRDTVAHNGADMAAVRWTYDEFFRRDGRNIGSCNWMTIASAWCLDLWRPLEDLTLDQALMRIRPVLSELNTIITAEHLIDDYVLSRNIARFGLKFTTLIDLLPSLGFAKDAGFFWHQYTISVEEKVREMRKVIDAWKVPASLVLAD